MKIINKMIINDLRLNKKRTVITIIGIILATALLTLVAIMYSSIKKTLDINFIKKKGDFNVEFLNVPKNDLEIFRCNRKIDKIYVTSPIGYIKDSIKESGNTNDTNHLNYQVTQIQAYTKEALDKLPIKLLSGRMPQNENEIIIPKIMNPKKEIGNEMAFDILDDRDEKGVLVDPNPIYIDEKIKGKENIKKYTVVGLMESRDYQFIKEDSKSDKFITYQISNYITLANESSMAGALDLYVKYNDGSYYNVEQNTSSILGIGLDDYSSNEHNMSLTKMERSAKYSWRENDNVNLPIIQTLLFERNRINGRFLEVIFWHVCAILAFSIIFLLSVVCIKSSFDISCSERIKLYAIFRSVGSTKKQIKRSVLFEAILVGIIGTLIGIFIGIVASYILSVIYIYLLAFLYYFFYLLFVSLLDNFIL